MGLNDTQIDFREVSVVLDGFMWESIRNARTGTYKYDLVELESCMVVMSGPWRKRRASAASAALSKLVRLLKGAIT